MRTEHDPKQPPITKADIQSDRPAWGDFAVATGNDTEQASVRPAKREIIPQNRDIPDRLKMDTSLPWNAPNGDIHIRSVNNPDGRGDHYKTNVGWSVFAVSTGGFATGPYADGAYDLALNILNQFVPPGADGHPSVKYSRPHWAPEGPSEASKTAHVLESAFRQEFIYKMSPEGGTISGEAIRKWIDDRQHLIAK
jgi:hypothetical protein